MEEDNSAYNKSTLRLPRDPTLAQNDATIVAGAKLGLDVRFGGKARNEAPYVLEAPTNKRVYIC